MYQALFLIIFGLSTQAIAQTQTYKLKGITPNCPSRLEIQERYDVGILKQIAVSNGVSSFACKRLDGQPVAEWNPVEMYGYYLTCSISSLPRARGYALSIVYDHQRGQGEYGFSERYALERTAEGARYYKVQSGRPIYCEYR